MKIKVVTEYTRVKAGSEHQIPCLYLYPEGQVCLGWHSTNGFSQKEQNCSVIAMQLSQFEYNIEFGGRVVSQKKLRSFIQEHRSLFHTLMEGWLPNGRGEYSFTPDADKALEKLSELVHGFGATNG